jgi:hypothetical protein
MSKKWYRGLTPEAVWSEYVGNSVELFISFFHYESEPVTDITEMCRIYAKDICNGLSRPYSLEQLNYIAGLLESYIRDYIKKVGGYDKLTLYTREEVEAIEDETTQELLETIEWYRNLKQY